MVSRILSIVLGLFYIISGIGKLLDVSTFAGYVWTYGITYPYNMYIAIAIPPLEILLGITLLFFVKNKFFSIVSLITIILFTIGFAYAYFINGVDGCGCFGVITALATKPLFSFLRNAIILSISLYLIFRPVITSKTSYYSWQLIVLFFVGAVGFSASGISLNEALYAPEPFLNKHIKETPISKYTKTSPDSSYLVFCMSLSCPHCWNATENIKAYKTTGKVDRIITLAWGTDSLLTEFKKKFSPNFDMRLFKSYAPIADIVGTNGVPKVFFVRQDTIIHIINSEVESPWSSTVRTRKKK